MRERHKISLMTVSNDSVINRIPKNEFEMLKRRAKFERSFKNRVKLPIEILNNKSLIDFSNKVAEQIRLFKLKKELKLTTIN